MGFFKNAYWTLSAYYDVLEMNILEKVFKQKSAFDNPAKVEWDCLRIRKKNTKCRSEVMSQEQIKEQLRID